MEIQTFQDLSNLSYLLPSQYSSDEKMPFSANLKKKCIVDVWHKIIIEGNGFVSLENVDLNENLKLYLKDKCITKKIDNFAVFCRKWCEEVLPTLKITKEKEIERIYSILSVLNKEFLENDTYAVQERLFSADKFNLKYLSISNLSYSDVSSFISSLMDIAFSSSYAAPWWIRAMGSSFSHFRSTRQVIVGTKTVVASLKKRFEGLVHHVDLKFKDFETIQQAKMAKSFSLGDVVQRNEEMTLARIREISSERLVALASRVAAIVCCVGLLFWPVTALLGFVVFLGSLFPCIKFIDNDWNGIIPAACADILCLFLQTMCANILPIFFTIIMFLALHLSSTLILLVLCPIYLVAFLLVVFFQVLFIEKVKDELVDRFFNTPPFAANDPLRHLLSPLTKGADIALDNLLSLWDGHAQAVKFVEK